MRVTSRCFSIWLDKYHTTSQTKASDEPFTTTSGRSVGLISTETWKRISIDRSRSSIDYRVAGVTREKIGMGKREGKEGRKDRWVSRCFPWIMISRLILLIWESISPMIDIIDSRDLSSSFLEHLSSNFSSLLFSSLPFFVVVVVVRMTNVTIERIDCLRWQFHYWR